MPLSRSNTLHPTSGLIFQYLSQYSPTDTIIPLAISIPPVREMCYLIPYHGLLSALNTITNAHTAQLLHLQKGQLKLALMLNHTQNSLNQSIYAIQRQGTVLSQIGTYTQYLNTRITKVDYITSRINVTLHDKATNLPPIDLLNHLLIQKAVYFVPPPKQAPPSVIGLWSISSFFAALNRPLPSQPSNSSHYPSTTTTNAIISPPCQPSSALISNVTP